VYTFIEKEGGGGRSLINHNAIVYKQIMLLKIFRLPGAADTFTVGRMVASHDLANRL
jgi:hypothetical protein